MLLISLNSSNTVRSYRVITLDEKDEPLLIYQSDKVALDPVINVHNGVVFFLFDSKRTILFLAFSTLLLVGALVS